MLKRTCLASVIRLRSRCQWITKGNCDSESRGLSQGKFLSGPVTGRRPAAVRMKAVTAKTFVYRCLICELTTRTRRHFEEAGPPPVVHCATRLTAMDQM